MCSKLFLSSNFVFIVIATIRKKSKEPTKRDNNLKIIKADCRTQERVDKNNDVEKLSVDKDILVPIDKNTFALANQDVSALIDKNIPVIVNRSALADR